MVCYISNLSEICHNFCLLRCSVKSLKHAQTNTRKEFSLCILFCREIIRWTDFVPFFFSFFFRSIRSCAQNPSHRTYKKKKKKVLHTADTIILWIKFCKLGAAKAKKGRKTSVDTSASEVINLNENAVSLTTLFLFMLIFILVLYYKSMPKSGFES